MQIDLAGVFLPQTPLLEIFVRGTLTYLALFVLLRVGLKRQSGSMGVTDLLVIVLIADAAQNAMADDYKSVTDGVFLVGTILFWAYALDWLGYRFPALERVITPGPLPLIENGRVNRRNMRSELITHDELMTQLRMQGVEEIDQVKRAFLEANGELTVVKAEGETDAKRRKRAT